MVDNSKEYILCTVLKIMKHIYENSKPLEKEFSDVIDENFWNLLA